MFEALRGLRDAVAPESGNLGGNANNNNNNNNNSNAGDNQSSGENAGDFDDFFDKYRSGDPTTAALVKKASGGTLPQKKEDFVRLYARLEIEKDSELVTKLAGTILEKSDEIQDKVSNLPGMNRSRKQQMEHIAKLLDQNQKAAAELEEHYTIAKERRDQVRSFIRDNTCEALGIQEGDLI